MQNETYLKDYSTVNNAIIQLGDTDDSGKGRHFKSRFIQPGVAGYPGQFGNVLITKESLDKFIDTMVGVPVIVNHKSLDNNNVDDERVGVVNSVWYDDKDGWYWCDGIIWNAKAQELITDKGWSVSCSYDVKTADDKGGTENNIKYDMEFLDGVFTHLALVNNPRYERANIVFNSKTFNISNYRIDQKRDKYGRFACEGRSSFFNSWKDAPEFELKQNELHQYIDDIEELRKQSKKYYHNNLQGKPIEREELGEIRVSGKGLDEYFHFSSDIDKLLAVPMVPELIKKGKLGEFEEDYKGRNDNIVGYYPIYANLKTSNGVRKAELLIAKDKDGKLFYQMFLDFDRLKAQERALKKEATAGTNPPASNNIINAIQENFNPNVKEHEDMNIQNWNEQDHPRDEQGKFTEKGGEDKKQDLEYDPMRKWAMKFETEKLERQRKRDKLSGKLTREAQRKDFDSFYNEYGDLFDTKDDVRKFHTLKQQEYKQLLFKRAMADNSKEKEMALIDELKKLITKVENNKENETMVENEKVDKRKLIDEVGGILKGKVDDEVIRTIIGKMEKMSYDDSEASADNKKVKNEAEEDEKVDNEEEKEEEKKVDNESEEDEEKVEELKKEEKKDVDNKCKNSKEENYFDKLNKIYNSAKKIEEVSGGYEDKQARLDAGKEYFG